MPSSKTPQNEALDAKFGVDTAENALWKESEKRVLHMDPVGDLESFAATFVQSVDEEERELVRILKRNFYKPSF